MFKRIFTISLVVLGFLSIGTLAISQMDKKTKDNLYSQIELFSYALTTIQADYVDALTPKDLIYGALKGMLGSLDPHSQFLDPDEYKELKTETQGKFGGLGIEISIRDGLLTVITPIEDTPAWKSGIKAGDRIVKIEDEVTKDLSLGDAVKKLRGKPGTDVHITVLREDEFKILDFTVTREIIHIQDVKNTQILTDKIGYVRLAEFREDSANEMHKAIEQLRKDGANSLILDLRNNPGGLLNVAIEITEEFTPAGEIIVSTKGRHSSQNTITKSTNTDHVVDWPIAVLINKGSASGSEILAGALKDNKHAVIIGTTSFGKGSVQSVIPLPDGSGLRLTTSKYFTPSGASIHEKGIKPDIIVEEAATDDEDKDNGKDDKKGKDKEKEKNIDKIFKDIKSKDAKDKPESELDVNAQKLAEAKEKLLSDNQVQTAISVLKGIKVYNGFGETLSVQVGEEDAAKSKDNKTEQGQEQEQDQAPEPVESTP
jgi:carboxyl-terminal processing protease